MFFPPDENRTISHAQAQFAKMKKKEYYGREETYKSWGKMEKFSTNFFKNIEYNIFS